MFKERKPRCNLILGRTLKTATSNTLVTRRDKSIFGAILTQYCQSFGENKCRTACVDIVWRGGFCLIIRGSLIRAHFKGKHFILWSRTFTCIATSCRSWRSTSFVGLLSCKAFECIVYRRFGYLLKWFKGRRVFTYRISYILFLSTIQIWPFNINYWSHILFFFWLNRKGWMNLSLIANSTFILTFIELL